MKYIIFIIIFSFTQQVLSQAPTDQEMIKRIYDEVLTKGEAYKNLAYLSKEIGARLAGSDAYNKAVDYTKELLETIDATEVSTQECEVDYWERGTHDVVVMQRPYKDEIKFHALALGNSGGTENDGILSEVIEVHSLEELEKLGPERVNGKIVFYNRPMDPKLINTFQAYGGAVDQRVFGPNAASKLGAIGVIVRSITLRQDNAAHTGVTIFRDSVNVIPAMAISTNDADILSSYIKESTVQIFINTASEQKGIRKSWNVIAEMKGSEFPDEIILVGAHLDTWDAGDGSHDDGAGCVQAIEVLRLFQAIGYQPKRTIRCVLFANEEKGLDGATKYAEVSNSKNEYHIAAIESDAGGFTPRGFSIDAEKSLKPAYFEQISNWKSLFKPYLIDFQLGYSGVDINLLKSQKGVLFGLRPDSQRYFDVHHSENDVFDTVNIRELHLGAAAMCALTYLLDQHGIVHDQK